MLRLRHFQVMKYSPIFSICLLGLFELVGSGAKAQTRPFNGLYGDGTTFSPSSYSTPMTQSVFSNPLTREAYEPRLLRLPTELSNMNYSHVMIAPGTSPIVTSEGIKKRGDLIATIPFRFRQLGQLSQPVKSGRDGHGPNLLEAGAIGYRVNPFRITQGVPVTDAWCFTEASSRAGASVVANPKGVCLFKLVSGRWVSGPTRGAFPNTLLGPRTLRANVGDVLIDLASPNEAPERRLELRFKNWSIDGVVIEAFVDGELIENVTVTKKSTGEVELQLLSQSLAFSRSGRSDASAIITTIARRDMIPVSATQHQLARLNQVLDENLVAWGTYSGRPGFEALTTRVQSQTVLSLASIKPHSVSFRPNDTIATQTKVPSQVFEVKSTVTSDAKRFGASGTILFRVDIGSQLHVLCTYDPAMVALNNGGGVAKPADRYCLQDSDDDSLYETVWKTPTFAPGSRYHLLDLANSQKLSHAPSRAIRVEPTNSLQMVPDILSLTYSGPIYDPVLTRPGLVQLTWRYGSDTSGWPILAMSANFDANRTAVLTTDSWRPDGQATTGATIARITDIQLSGAADIQLLPENIQDPTILRRAAIEGLVENINQLAAARAALKVAP